MDTKPLSFELKVGIFVFIGIIVLFIFVFSIGEFYIMRPIYRFSVLFGFANGIEVGSPVRLAGVEMGEVENINVYYDENYSKTIVKLGVNLRENTRIEKNATCRINTLGLLGEKYLEITPGTPDTGFVKDGDTLIGHDPIPVEEVTKTVKELADTAKSLTESANVILSRLEQGEGTIGKFLVKDDVYNNIEAFTEDIKKHPWKLLYRAKEKTSDKAVSEGPKKNF